MAFALISNPEISRVVDKLSKYYSDLLTKDSHAVLRYMMEDPNLSKNVRHIMVMGSFMVQVSNAPRGSFYPKFPSKQMEDRVMGVSAKLDNLKLDATKMDQAYTSVVQYLGFKDERLLDIDNNLDMLEVVPENIRGPVLRNLRLFNTYLGMSVILCK